MCSGNTRIIFEPTNEAAKTADTGDAKVESVPDTRKASTQSDKKNDTDASGKDSGWTGTKREKKYGSSLHVPKR